MKLGSTRLYKAIKEGNTGLVSMYMLSFNDNNDAVQNFRYKQVWDAWEEAGCSIEMLNALVQHQPMMQRWRNRRNGETNNSFSFGNNLADKITKLLTGSPQTADLLKAKALAHTVETLDRGTYIPHRPLLEPLVNGETWPFSIMAESLHLANTILTYSDFTYEVKESIVDWYIGMFGIFQQSENVPDLVHLLEEPTHTPLLFRLVPDVKLQRALFKTYPYRRLVDKAVQGHRRYLELQPLAPWIDDIDDIEDDEDDE